MLELKSTFQSLPCIFIVHIKKNTGELEDVNFVYSCHSNVKFISPRHRVISSMYVFPFHLTLLRGSGRGSLRAKGAAGIQAWWLGTSFIQS